MYISLEMKKKFGFVDGSIKKSDSEDPNFLAWKRCNTLIISWFYHSISPEIVSSILWLDDAFSIWQELRNRFSQGDFVRISQLTYDLSSLKQGDSSITTYFTTLKKLSDELYNFRPIPSCKYSFNGCCNTFSTVTTYREHDLILYFLQGLNETYTAVRSQIFLLDPLPSLTKIYSMILQQEQQLHIGLLLEPTVMIVNSSVKPYENRSKPNFKSTGGKPPNSRLCIHCKKTNHTIDKCYFLHGFPPGYQTKKVVHSVETNP
ncbi:uncharacterized protein [Cicer arietinum]|uniref:Uncharacterized protein LOC101491396 n=1 Tax=Cicer arietinum TaxID=3827 RepID=A0A1S2XF35_CICAR|nr:uncharacterized protein LOC101491396 [Cicer arietinum]